MPNFMFNLTSARQVRVKTEIGVEKSVPSLSTGRLVDLNHIFLNFPSKSRESIHIFCSFAVLANAKPKDLALSVSFSSIP